MQHDLGQVFSNKIYKNLVTLKKFLNQVETPFYFNIFKQNLQKPSHPEKYLNQVETPFYFNIFKQNLQKPGA